MAIDDRKFTATIKLALVTTSTVAVLTMSAAGVQAAGTPLNAAVPGAPPAAETPGATTMYATDAQPDSRADHQQPIPVAAADTEVVYEQDDDSKKLSQAVAQASTTIAQPTDLAPVKLPERTSSMAHFEEFKTNALYRLPSRMFLNATVENSLRLETNVLQTASRNRADMIYRILPNATIGYALTKTTRFSGNYFYFRDQYMRNRNALSRNIHSLGLRLDQDVRINERTTATVSFFGRQLLLSRTRPLFDLLPSATVVRRVGDRGAIYGSLLGQIRFRDTLGTFQEYDQFVSLGGVYRRPRLTLLADHTFIANWGKRHLRGGPDNAVFVLTYEAAYKIHPVVPVSAFVRAEPIFNIGANQAIGFAGFNFRLFGGLRFEVAKPPIFPVKIRRS